MLQTTLSNFKYPETLVKELPHWYVLLHPKQPTLGTLIVVHRGEQTRFSEISAEAFDEFKTLIPFTELTLKKLFGYEKINYLALMMHNPEVHFTILPRYGSMQEFNGVKFIDSCWPTVPNIAEMQKDNHPTDETLSSIVNELKEELIKYEI